MALGSQAVWAETTTYAEWGWVDPRGPELDIRWRAKIPETVLSSRWSIDDCNESTSLCVLSDGTSRGSTSVGMYSLVGEPEVREDLETGTRQRALRRHARRYYGRVIEDRGEVCPAGYTVRPLTFDRVTVANRAGVRYGFTVHDETGARVERTVSFATLTKDFLVLIYTESLNEDACYANSWPTLRPRQLRAYEPYLANVVAQAKLPRQ